MKRRWTLFWREPRRTKRIRRSIRKEQGLTQDQLSEMAGYSRNHLQRVETAVCKPTVGLLLDVSEVLGVPVERLMEIRK